MKLNQEKSNRTTENFFARYDKRVFIIVGLVIGISAMTSVWFFVPSDSRFTNDDHQSTLSPSEIASERERLSENNPDLVITNESFQEPELYDSYIPNFPISGSNPPDRKPNFDENMNLLSEQDSETDPDLQLAGVSKVKVYTDPNSDVTMSVTRSDDEKINKTVEGTVFEIKEEIGRITIVQKDDKGLASVILRPDTVLTVNDKPIALNQLKVADRLQVEGFGYKNNSTIEARVIKLIGFVEVTD